MLIFFTQYVKQFKSTRNVADEEQIRNVMQEDLRSVKRANARSRADPGPLRQFQGCRPRDNNLNKTILLN